MAAHAQVGGEEAGKWELVKGFTVTAVGFAALQCSTTWIKPRKELWTKYYMSCGLIVAAFAVTLMGSYVPQNDSSLGMAFNHLGVYFAATSLFMSFSMLLPEVIWVELSYLMVYLAVITVIIVFLRRRINSSQATSTVINNV